MDTKLIAKIREAVIDAKKNGNFGVRYSEFVKSSVQQMLKSGASCSELSGQLGICKATLFKWSGPVRRGKAFRKLKVASAPLPGSVGLAIVLPDGVRIEGCETSLLKKILESLK